MATTDLEKLIVKLDADLRSYEKALAKAQGTTVSQMRKIEREVQRAGDRVETQFARMGAGFKNFAKGLGIGIGIETFRRLGDVIQQTVADAARIGDVADRIGIGTDQLQALNEAARGADMSFDDLSTSLLRFSKELGKAANGQGDLLKLFQANGKQISGDFSTNLNTFADLVKNARSEQEAWLIITQAMGKGAEGMIEVLKNGSTGIQNFTRNVKTSGTAIDEAFIRKAQEIDDKWQILLLKLSTQAKTVGIQIAENLDKAMSLEGLTDPQNLNPVIKWLLGIEKPKPQMPDLETIRAAPGAGTVQPTTKVPNPQAEADAAKAAAQAKRDKAAADRDAARALDEHNRALLRGIDAFQGELQSTYDAIEAMELEAQARGMGTAQREAFLTQHALMKQAIQGEITLTPELIAQINEVANAYGNAVAEAEEFAERSALIAELNQTVQGALEGVFSDIAEGVQPVEALTNALKDLAKQLAQIVINRALTDLIGGGTTGGGGLFGALLKHQGGVVGSSGRRRMVSPAAFIGAPRMHSGGIAGDEMPTILKKGEIVLPKGFRSGGGGGFGNVEIHNHGGKVEQRQERGPNGERQLRLWFDANFDRRLASESTQQFLGVSTGIRPTIARRSRF